MPIIRDLTNMDLKLDNLATLKKSASFDCQKQKSTKSVKFAPVNLYISSKGVKRYLEDIDHSFYKPLNKKQKVLANQSCIDLSENSTKCKKEIKKKSNRNKTMNNDELTNSDLENKCLNIMNTGFICFNEQDELQHTDEENSIEKVYLKREKSFRIPNIYYDDKSDYNSVIKASQDLSKFIKLVQKDKRIRLNRSRLKVKSVETRNDIQISKSFQVTPCQEAPHLFDNNSINLIRPKNLCNKNVSNLPGCRKIIRINSV